MKKLFLSRIQRAILRDLYKAGGKLDGYTFYRRYKLDPFDLINATSRLIAESLLSVNEENIFLITAEGKDFLLNSGIVEDTDSQKPWLAVPEEFVKPRMEPWQPYVPSIRLLDKNLLKLDRE
jgi:hypothetical protein